MSELKTIDIKGKAYVMVHERVRYFREEEAYKDWQIFTEIIDLQDHRIIMKASVINPEGTVMATGHAFEYSDGGQINKTSFVENCETSAIGRALGCLGIGIQESFATAEEVAQAIHQQKDSRAWLSQKQFGLAVQRIQSANPKITINEDGNDLELTPAEFVKKLKDTYRMKKEYADGLEYEVQFQETLSNPPTEQPI